MITVQVQTQPASHALLTSFGLSEVQTSGTDPYRMHRGESSRRGDRAQRHSLKGITLARGRAQRKRNGAGT